METDIQTPCGAVDGSEALQTDQAGEAPGASWTLFIAAKDSLIGTLDSPGHRVIQCAQDRAIP
jgi:hypothetical protein